MRLIDADLLRKQFGQRELEKNGRYMNGTMISNVRNIIDEAPTVERPHGEVERPHGEWELIIEDYYTVIVQCSICGRLLQLPKVGVPDIKIAPYCTCGAKMSNTEG